MPRKAAFKIRAIDELFQQLRYVPADTRQRQMDAAESLIHEIDPERNYPESFIVFRITGYRPDSGEDESTLVGEALTADLANFVLRLSERLQLSAEGEDRRAIPLDEVATKLNVAPRSVQRYRRKGLVVHSIIFPDGTRRLGCYEDALERFIAYDPDSVQHAASFSRVDEEDEHRIIEAARELRGQQRSSLNTVAQRIARSHGRSHETIRRILRRHDRDSPQPIFAEYGSLSPRDLQLIYRAWRRQVPTQSLAARFGRSAVTIHRIVNHLRAEQLAALDIDYVRMPTLELDDAESVYQSLQIANEGLNQTLPMNDALALVEQAEQRNRFDEHDQGSLIACYNFSKKRAMDLLSSRPEWPGARLVDEIESSLRWATMIKQRLLSEALPTAFSMIELHVGQRLMLLPADEIRAMVGIAVMTSSHAIETINPGKSQRLDRITRYAIAREMARRPERELPKRAGVRHTGGEVVLPPLLAVITPWNRLLALPDWLAAVAHQLTRPAREIVVRHYGLDGTRPQTCRQIAVSMRITDTAVRRKLTDALLQMRRMTRERNDR